MNTAPYTQAMSRALFAAVLAGSALAIATPAGAGGYAQTNLVTDDPAAVAAGGYSPASPVDANLVNPWGMDHAPLGPWVVADAGFPTGSPGPTSMVTSYNGDGVKTALTFLSPQNGAGGSAGLTGLAYNGGTGFDLPSGGPATYLFSNLDGSISGWNSAQTAAVQVVPGRAGGNKAKYSGMDLGAFGGQTYLYAANHFNGKIDVFDESFAPVSFGANAFVDPLENPKGLLAYNVESIGGDVWVTYAAASAATAPLGSGFVDQFTADGQFIRRFAAGGDLASPWAVTLAPSHFGAYSGDVLIGNFTHRSYGYISAYRESDGAFEGLLSANGAPIAIDGLWELAFGGGGDSGPTNALYFTAGIDKESHGLFGMIGSVPEPATWALMLVGVAAMGAQLRSARRRAIALD
ncbi:MAG: TIGR03118 family protein [Caulobacteraceae bacterium]